MVKTIACGEAGAQGRRYRLPGYRSPNRSFGGAFRGAERLDKPEDSVEVFFSQLAQLPRRQLHSVGSEARILVLFAYDPGDVHAIHLGQRGELLGGYSPASCLDLGNRRTVPV